MRRYWIPKEALEGDTVKLTGDVLHHVRDVCRLHKGSKFELLTETGQAFLVEITEENKQASIARVLESRVIPALPEPHIHLALSIPRFPVFEAVLEKSVELGVKSVHPFFSDFSFIRKQEDVFEKKRTRFEKIVMGATQQSGRGSLMPIEEPVGVENLIQTFNRVVGAKGLFAYEGPGVLTAPQAVDEMRRSQASELWIFVGSEGGFSEREVELFASSGLKAVTLGSQVLRVETACVALVSILKYGFDLMR